MFGSLVPWRERSFLPLRMVNRFEDQMEDLMDRFLGGEGGWLRGDGFLPRVDLVENDNQFEVVVDLPGLKPEEVDLELKDGDLWITGKREEETEEKGKTLHRIERRHGSFQRMVPLPKSIDEEKIEARFENGVMKITLPKAEDAKTKHIEVKV